MKKFLNTIVTAVKVLALSTILCLSFGFTLCFLQYQGYNALIQLLVLLPVFAVTFLFVFHQLLMIEDKSKGRKPMGLKNLL